MCLPVTPYKVEREWIHAGLQCAVVQARLNGHRCGYVRIPPSHPWHGQHYDNPQVNVNVHGGLTFAQLELCEEKDGTGWWFGFDCAHYGDSSYDPNADEGEMDAGERAFFLRIRDLGEHYWIHDEVVHECEMLAGQIAAAAQQ